MASGKDGKAGADDRFWAIFAVDGHCMFGSKVDLLLG